MNAAARSRPGFIRTPSSLNHEQQVPTQDVMPSEVLKDILKKQQTSRPTLSTSKIRSLSSSTTEIDASLQAVQQYLANFQTALGEVSAQIEGLQSRSVRLDSQVNIRKRVEKLLGPQTEATTISPYTIRSINEGPINEEFARSITEIEARWLTMTSKSKDKQSSTASSDLLPVLDNLKLKAVIRIRDVLVAQIKAIRSPNVNVQVIQRRNITKQGDLYPFLVRNSPQLAEEIGTAYVNTLRWYYTSSFQRYDAALGGLQLFVIDHNELLGSDPAIKRAGMLGQAKATQHQLDPFSLGRRADFLRLKDIQAIPAHLAEDSKSLHYMEVPFRNYNQVLLDNLSAEYAVATTLFSIDTFQQVSRRVSGIFAVAFSTGHKLTERLVEHTTDCFGIMLCIRFNQKLAYEAQRRKLPIMDDYINYTNILLWPQFQRAMDAHSESLKKVSVSATRGANVAFTLTGGHGAAAITAPHPVTQRFAQLLAGILNLSSEADEGEPTFNSLSRMRSEYEASVTRLAKTAGDASKRMQCLFNNYSLVLTIISDTTGKLAQAQRDHFEGLVKENKPR